MPITAGIFMFLASMAVWEFDEPCAVTNARTLSLSSATVSLGARSSAQTIMLSQDYSGTVRSAGEVSDYAVGDIPDIG